MLSLTLPAVIPAAQHKGYQVEFSLSLSMCLTGMTDNYISAKELLAKTTFTLNNDAK